jgi:hypothetical protein
VANGFNLSGFMCVKREMEVTNFVENDDSSVYALYGVPRAESLFKSFTA